MNLTQHSTFRLVTRGERGLSCDENGLALGAVDLALVHSGGEGVGRYEVRSPGQIGRLLRVAYGPLPESVVLRLHRGLRRAAASVAAGDLGRAGVEALQLGFPGLSPDAMVKLSEVADLEKTNGVWETEPRVPSGQPGAGQWTTDGSAPASRARVGRRASAMAPARRLLRPSASPVDRAPRRQTANGAAAFGPANRGLLIHVNTAATGAYGVAGDLSLPKGVARLGRAGLLTFAAALLDDAAIRSAQDQISKAVFRFGLDPSRPADVVAASAYVWSRYALPMLTQAPFRGAALDAASQAVMRFVLANPGAFTGMRQNAKSLSLVIDAANGGLSDYAVESSARPRGVDPSLQTKSYRARKAIASQLETGQMQAHHLVPAVVWGSNLDIATLAQKAGWHQDSPSNLIALPADAATRAGFGYTLPIHNGGGHGIYNAYTEQQILSERAKYPLELTPLQARSILQDVASRNRLDIIAGVYRDLLKADLQTHARIRTFITS